MNSPLDPRSARRPRRQRETRRSVLFVERIARVMITAGGIGTILAVSSIFLFLVYVVAPIFLGSSISPGATLPRAGGRDVAACGMGEDGHLLWELEGNGGLRLVLQSTGEEISRSQPFGQDVPTATSLTLDQERAAFGFEDGSICTGRLGLGVSYLEDEPHGGPFTGLQAGESTPHDGGLVVRTEQGGLRYTFPKVELDEPLDTRNSSAIESIDMAVTPSGPIIAARHADGALRVYRVRSRENLMTGELTRELVSADIPLEEDAPDFLWMGVSGGGIDLFAVSSDGDLRHYDLREFGAPRLLDQRDLLPEPERFVTAVDFLLGRRSILVGDSAGRLRVWFPVRGGEGEREGLVQPAQVLISSGPPVIRLASSSRSRLLVSGDAEGQLRLFHVTSAQQLAEMRLEGAPSRLLISPEENVILASNASQTRLWNLERRYPEASPAGLFSPVWYEGYPQPTHVWQSSSGADDFEPKLGMVPLVFGTLKATFYSMLFGAPLALLAAIFTSEFLAPRARTRLKAIIELMASLPSVVLGFLGAMVVAPFLEGVLMEALVSVYLVPFTMLSGAYLWQLLSPARGVRWSGMPRLVAIAICIPIGLAFARLLGKPIEGLLFHGDLIAWLDGQVGSGAAGGFLLLIPLVGLLVSLFSGRLLAPLYRTLLQGRDRAAAARFDLIKFVALTGVTLVLSAVAAYLLDQAGFDPRGEVVGTYVQRNAMIVGFVMGFAIIPMIYTLAEDSLSEVPTHLREGSLGAGATPWQTAVRIVIPAAMSGLFSAVMIGLGRAVGETMIVLMAAGNTPIMDLNIFNGFRTLSANIAVEMPEAVPDSAHYRTLFLAALVLFAMTFVLNTIAEAVRRHFRARTKAL